MPYLNIPESRLANLIAREVGKLQATFRGKVSNELSSIIEEISSECPPAERIVILQKKLEPIKSIVLSAKKKVESFEKLSSNLGVTSNSFNVIISTLTALPAPASLVTVGALNTFSNQLNTLKELRTQLRADSSFISLFAVSDLSALITSVENSVQFIDAQLQRCANGLPLEDFQDTPTDTETSEEFFYRNYKLSIVVVEPDQIAPKRKAVATDSLGIIRFEGDESYSSSTDILIRELRFIIDRELS